jgi:ABC-2 type transport system permease protein
MTTMSIYPAGDGGRPGSTTPILRTFIAAEWIKLRTVRSTTYTLVTAAVVAIGIGAFACQRLAAELSGGTAPFQPDGKVGGIDGVSRSLIGGIAAQLALGALGVLVVTSEFGTGMIRASLAAMPQRGRWIAAKLAVFGAVALVVGQVLTFASFGIGQAILSGEHGGASLADPNVLRTVVATGLYIALIGLLGAAFGLIIRHTAGAITGVLGALFVLPAVASAFPAHLQNAIVRYFPETIGEQASTPHQLSQHLPAWGGIGLLIGYVAVCTALGALLLVRRDA